MSTTIQGSKVLDDAIHAIVTQGSATNATILDRLDDADVGPWRDQKRDVRLNRLNSLLRAECVRQSGRLRRESSFYVLTTDATRSVGLAKGVLDPESRVVRPSLATQAGTSNLVNLNAIRDKMPEFALIHKDQIRIDESYQRAVSSGRVRTIASDFSWVAFGALKIALRPDGEWYAFDGQHRQLAAMMRDDVTIVPCLVYEMETRAKEAEGFISQRTSKGMSRVDLYRASLIARDPTTLVIEEITRSAGLVVGHGMHPGDRRISCVGELVEQVKRDEPTLRRVFPVVAEIAAAGGMATAELVRGLVYLENKALPGNSLLDVRWRRRLAQELSWTDLDGSLKAARGFEGNAMPRTCANGILKAMNRNLRTKFKAEGFDS